MCNQVLAVVDRPKGRCADCPSTYDEDLYDALRAWRTKEATDIGKPAYVVFTDATLQAVAEMIAVDADALRAVPGIGPAKLEKYADAVLEIISAH